MSYNFLTNAAKNRIITELREAFSKLPDFKDIPIINKFPYEERIQEGIIVRNSSASRVALSADNYQGTVTSYVCLAKNSNFPGKSIEWVREDDAHLAEWIVKDDFSGQFQVFPQNNNTIKIYQNFYKGSKNLSFADNVKDVEVFINNQKVIPKKVDGENGIITLFEKPIAYSSVKVSYWVRNLASPGVYQVEITEGDPELNKYKFMVDPLLDVNETLIERTRGDETTLIINKTPIYKGSLRLRENSNLLVEDRDYIVNESEGLITLLIPLLTNSKITAFYRVQGLSMGPFEIKCQNIALNTAIPGVVLAFGRNVSIGDKQFVLINSQRVNTAKEYSGKWDMRIGLEVYAKDSHRIEQIIDESTSNLLFYRKEALDAEGIALVDVSFGGESETVFDEGTGDLYYTGTVEYTFLTEWIVHQPLLYTLEDIEIVGEIVSDVEPYAPNLIYNYAKIS
jgi:hypothetical protein